MGQYQTAQVCLNGHTVTSSLEGSNLGAKFCSLCGAQTVSQCGGCAASIRGYYLVPGVFGAGRNYTPPSFCHACGSPFPWTAEKLAAARELTDQLDELSADDKSRLKRSIQDLTTDGPRTELATFEYSKLLRKVSKTAGAALQGIVVSVASAAAKKLLGL